MSGGSWDYVYSTIDDTASRLLQDRRPDRHALGSLLADVSTAMLAIEWNDSGDGADGEHEKIMKCLSDERIETAVSFRIDEMEKELAGMRALLAEREKGKKR